MRRDNAALLSIEAHAAPHAVTGLAVTYLPQADDSNRTVIATCSTDCALKLWTPAAADSQLQSVFSRQFGSPLFCLDFCRDAPSMLACGGQNGFDGRNIAPLLKNV